MSLYELIFWLLSLEKRYQKYINKKNDNLETERYWYTHKMVIRSFITIKKALPNMFHYLDNPKIPKSILLSLFLSYERIF